MSHIFITGATGYLGRALIPVLLQRGHTITAIVRSGSEKKIPSGVRVITGDALNTASLKSALGDCDTWIQLIGTPHPGPWKTKQFHEVDAQAVIASLKALPGSNIRHYVYLSVADPIPTMQAYIKVRRDSEKRIQEMGIAATFLRPWYILGPGHRWPYILIPIYKVLEKIPSLRAGALRMGLVTRKQMIQALVWAAENPPEGIRVLSVPEIRASIHSPVGEHGSTGSPHRSASDIV